MSDPNKIKLERRYSSLRTIAAISRIMGVLVTLIFGVMVVAAFQGTAGYLPWLVMAGTATLALLLFAGAESIQVIIDIEENTRRTWLVAEFATERHLAAAETKTTTAA